MTSVERLSEVLHAINSETEGLERHQATLHFVNDVWAGYNQKIAIGFKNAATAAQKR